MKDATLISNELHSLLREAIELDGAYKGLIQLYDQDNAVLRVVAQIGFGETFLKLFDTVKAFDPSACGRALGLKAPITIGDVTADVAFAPFIKVIESEEFLSVKAIPLLIRDEVVIGILSTHFRTTQDYSTKLFERIPDVHLVKIIALLLDLRTLARIEVSGCRESARNRAIEETGIAS